MKKAISIAVCMAVSVSVFVQSSAFAEEPVFSGEKETYIVLTETEKDGKKIQSQFDGEILLGDEAVSCELTEHQAERLEQQSGVIAVSEDIILEGSGKKSKKKLSAPAEQWNLEAIGADNSEAKPTGVKIEVLDSGVSYTDDINIMGEVNLVPGEEEVSPMFVDANGHGTGIAGLIGAKDNKDGIKGVFPDAEIYSVKAFDENLKSPLSRIVEGIYWGIENDMDIINMSFGTTVNSAVLHQAIKDAEAAGILLIAAAGNTEHQDINYPAAYDEVIAVGSINAEGKLAELTSTGTELELLAPGEQVCTTGLFYGTIGVSGTSIATAQVTGAAAMLKAKDKTKSNDFIRGLLKTSSKEVEGTNAGLIDCEYALKIYDEYSKSYTKGEKAVEKLENNEAVPDYSDQADIVVEGLWSTGKHTELIDYANLETSKLSSSDISLIAKIATWCDTKWFIGSDKDDDPETNPCNAVHGSANYVFTLKYLWNFAKKIETTPTSTLVSDASYAASAYALSFVDRTKFSKDEDNKLINLAIRTQELINNYGGSKNGRGRRNLVFGFIFHLLGDTFAHRTIVPTYTINSMTTTRKDSTSYTSKNARFGTSDFTTANLTTLKSRVNGVNIEFCGIFNLTKNGVKRSVYEDNPDFCAERYGESESACIYFLENYSKGFDWITFAPAYGVKMNYLKGYLIRLDEDTSRYTEAQWKNISTDKIVV